MAFDSLTEKLSLVFKKLRGKGRLSEADVKEAMREIRLALLAADVNFRVVREFVARMTERAVGSEVLDSLTPAQQMVKIVNEELTAMMGGGQSRLHMAAKPPTVVMLCGLQGAGKTTHCGKLALYFKNMGRRPLMAACDIYRPAAVSQLKIVGERIGIPVFSMPEGTDAVTIAREAVRHAKTYGNDMVFLDTAGRLHIDEELMGELKSIRDAVAPHEILLTVDAMTGQDAVNVAEAFNAALDISGVVLTKLDGDTRGGAALSVRHVTGKPVKFSGTGEKLGDLEPFHPERMASRILGMGDVLSLIEQAQQVFDEKKALELEKKLEKNRLDLNDFLDQMHQLKKLGPLEKVLSMVPGVNAEALKTANFDPRLMARMEAIVLSMTKKERARPEILNAARKRRVAAGSGTSVEEINRLLKNFEQMRTMVKRMNKNPQAFGRRGMPF